MKIDNYKTYIIYLMWVYDPEAKGSGRCLGDMGSKQLAIIFDLYW